MKKKITLSLLCSLATVFGCQSPGTTQQQQPNLYYDVAGFINGQVQLLAQQDPSVTKAMQVDGEEEVRTTKEVDWAQELELFIQADINKPAYRLSYITSRPDSLTYEYRVRPDEDLPVRYLRIRLNTAGGQPEEIEAKLLTENKLYQSEKNLLLRSGAVGGAWRVQSYQIRGYQELVVSDRKPFSISGQIN
ncbi:hypothetical protein [Telluribacter sp. SYSU D00476]|uniref:hypothetical protein n=1 Tax=Telluribacter sp. SYSU D00476 TaxID=2811430 RepID=UPI001FF459F6|nr:hypothetical protein [Telluribacter sp. SYSU D00476]